MEKYDKVILHSDLNNFYASVECLRNPQLENVGVVVCGNKSDRHGVVLAKNAIAKACGIKTGDVIWEAKQKCPNLVEITANFKLYLEYSKKVRKIYEKYTDKIEAFGIDECWLDVTESQKLFGTGREIAEKIMAEIKEKIGLTVSIGVSFNKIFAKLGSDYLKPSGITEITRENYKDIVWKLPVEELLYVGKATKRKLNKFNIFTIGDLALTPQKFLVANLGKWGQYLHDFANGRDYSAVLNNGVEKSIKSIGNSLTNYKDMETDDEIKALIYLLSESVASRLRESVFSTCSVVHLHARTNTLEGFGAQTKLPFPTLLSSEIATTAFKLFKQLFPKNYSIRGLGISVSGLNTNANQLSFKNLNSKYTKRENLEKTVDNIRKKHGNKSIQRLAVLKDKRMSQIDIKGEHVIHPENFFKK